MENLHPKPGLRTSLRSRPGTLFSYCYEEGKTATLPFLPTQWYHFYYYSFLILCLFMGSRSFAQSNTYDSSAWIPNGMVKDMVSNGNTVYLAGDFTYIGPAENVGRASTFDAVTGQPIPNFPKFDNSILAIAPDGSGGWYIGGGFRTVAGQTRNRLARINSDGSLHSWNPDVDGSVKTIAVSGNKVYVGGSFSTVNGGTVTRKNAAAFDANTGLATPWDPDAGDPSWGDIRSITVVDSLVFLGGYFNGINTARGNILRNGFAAVDTSTGVASSWNPRMGTGYSYLSTMTTDGSTLYVGGQFTSMGDSARKNLASFNLSTLELTPWNPNTSGTINTMLVSGSKVYLGGDFNTLNGSVPIKKIGSVDKTTGIVSAWNPIFDGAVRSMAMMGGTLYAGGAFKNVNNISSNRLVALDTITGNRTSCDLQVNNEDVSAVAASGGIICAGGNSFTSAGGKGRNRAAAINVSTGELTPWNPNINSQVSTMALARGSIYLGGNFDKANGNIARKGIVEVDTVTGMLTSWDPQANLTRISGIVVRGDTVYVGGSFSGLINGSVARNNLAAFDAITGIVTSWDPNSSEDIRKLAAYKDTLYMYFNGSPGFLNGTTPRNYLGAVDFNTGLATGFAPAPDGWGLSGLKVFGDKLYVGGDFNNIMGTARKSVAAIDLNTGNLSNWDPAPTYYGSANDISAIKAVGDVIYLGGTISEINGSVSRTKIAAVDTVLGTVLPWAPSGGSNIEVIEVIGNKIFVGGNNSNSNERQKYLHVYSCTSPTSGGTISTDQSGYGPFYPSGFTSVSGASGHSGALEYKWQASTTSSSAGFSDIAGAIYVAYQPDTLTQTTWFKRLARTCGNTWTAAIESNVIEVTVTYCTNPTSGGTIASAQSGLSPFDPAPFTNSTAASGHSGTLEYKWQFSTTSDSTGFADIASSDSNVYDAGSLTQTTWYKRVARVGCKSDWTGAAASNVLKVTVSIPKTWTGGNGNWNVAANWNDGTVPVNSDHLLINTGNPKLNVDYTVGGSLTLSGTGSLTVEAGKTLTVSGTADFAGKSVTFKSDATGTAQLGNLTGTLTGASNVTVERFIPATGRRWRLLTAPLTGLTVNDAWQKGQTWNGTAALTSDGTGTVITGQQQGSAANANAKGFDFWSAVSNSSTSIMYYVPSTTSGSWAALANTKAANAFNNGQAHLLFVRGPRGSGFTTGTANAATTLRPTGTLRQGEINVTVDGTKGHTMVGNPYASQIDFNSVYLNSGNSSVIKRQFWAWDATSGTSGNWLAVVYSVDKYVEVPRKFHTAGQASPLTAIQSGHGFTVQPVGASGGSMKIRESNKVAAAAASPNILLGGMPTTRLFVNLTRTEGTGGQTLLDGVMVAYDKGYRTEVTDAEDALKMENMDENLGVTAAGATLTADARPVSELGKPIELRLWNLSEGAYRFEVKTEEMESGGRKAWLEDRVRGTRTPLPVNGEVGSVEFTVGADAASRSENRFRIVFEQASVNASIMQELGDASGRTLSVYPNPVTGRTLTVRLRQVPKGTYSLQLLGGDGRLVTDRRIDHDGGSGTYRMELNGALPKGSYQLRCVNGERSIGSEKLLFQ